MKASEVRQAVAAHLSNVVDANAYRQIGRTAQMREGLYFDEKSGGFIDGHLAFNLEVVRVQSAERQRHHHQRVVSLVLQVGYCVRANIVDQVGDRDAALDLAETIELSFEEPVAGTVDVTTDAIDMLGETQGTYVVQLTLTARPENL
jgi:hypothetical protein